MEKLEEIRKEILKLKNEALDDYMCDKEFYGSSAYVFLMKERYYVTIERSDIIDYYVDCDKNSNDCNYVFKLMN